MTQWNEPPRLKLADEGADDLARELAAGLRAAHSEGPSAAQRARMRAALGLPAMNEPPFAEPQSPAPPALANAARMQLVRNMLGIALVLSAGLGVKLALDARTPQPLSMRATTPIAAPGLEPPAAPPAPPSTTSALEPAVPTPAPSRAAQPRSERRSRAERAAALEESPSSAAGPADVQAELALLRRARAHVRSAPARALALVAEHERDFARGALIEEREVIAIEALLESDRMDPAQRRALAFLASYPRSAHARRVHTLLEEHGISSRE